MSELQQRVARDLHRVAAGLEVPPAPLATLVAAGRRRQRRRRAGLVGGLAAAAAVVAILGSIEGGATLVRGSSRPAQPAASGGSGGTVPWTNTPAPQTSAPTPDGCRFGDLRIARGRVGVWQGRSVQALDVSNTSGVTCSFSPHSLSVTAITPGGRQVGVDTATGQDAVTLAAGQTVHVGLGAPADCASAPAIARTMQVAVAGGAAHRVDKAWLPVNCGRPRVVQVNVDPAPQGPEPLTATLHAPANATAGSTLRFTVTLTNTSGSEPVMFARCPSYYIGLKVARVDEGYQLNCEANPDLAPRESRTYQMQLAVPAGAAGSDVLTWNLNGHAVAGSVPIDVQ